MRQVLYLFISGFLAFLSCTQDKIQMVSLGIDDVYYLPRMKTYLRRRVSVDTSPERDGLSRIYRTFLYLPRKRYGHLSDDLRNHR
jgi:hypothetical protein